MTVQFTQNKSIATTTNRTSSKVGTYSTKYVIMVTFEKKTINRT